VTALLVLDCKGSLAAILISHYVIHPTSIYPCHMRILYRFDFTSSTTFLPSHVQLVQACLFQYKGFRLCTDVTVRNKAEEESALHGLLLRTFVSLSRSKIPHYVQDPTTSPIACHPLRPHTYVRPMNSDRLPRPHSPSFGQFTFLHPHCCLVVRST
jgi:hypothetical protein